MSPKPDAALIARIAREAQGFLGWVEAHAGDIVANYERWSDDGRKGRSYEGDGRGGQDLTHPERYAEAALSGRGDEIEQDWCRFAEALKVARQSCLTAKRSGENFIVDSSEGARREASSVASLKNEAAGAGFCVNCGHECSGARGKGRSGESVIEDRLKSKRCPPCYLWWYRSGFASERPRERWDEVQLEAYAVGAISDVPNRCVAEKWSAGIDYVCRMFEDHDGDHDWIKKSLIA